MERPRKRPQRTENVEDIVADPIVQNQQTSTRTANYDDSYLRMSHVEFEIYQKMRKEESRSRVVHALDDAMSQKITLEEISPPFTRQKLADYGFFVLEDGSLYKATEEVGRYKDLQGKLWLVEGNGRKFLSAEGIDPMKYEDVHVINIRNNLQEKKQNSKDEKESRPVQKKKKFRLLKHLRGVHAVDIDGDGKIDQIKFEDEEFTKDGYDGLRKGIKDKRRNRK